MKTKIAALAAAVVATAPTTASAAFYAVNYTSKDSSFSGIYETTDTADKKGFYTVIGLTGTRNGSAVTLLPPRSDTYMLMNVNDNLFNPNGVYYTWYGLLYEADGVRYNIFKNDSLFLEVHSIPFSDRSYNVTDFTVREVTAAVPEPATWAMMIIGFGMVGAASRYRRRSVATAIA